MEAEKSRQQPHQQPALTMTVDVPSFRNRTLGYVTALMAESLMAEIHGISWTEAAAVASSSLAGTPAPPISVGGRIVGMAVVEFIPNRGSFVIRVGGMLEREEVARAHFTVSVISRALINMKGAL